MGRTRILPDISKLKRLVVDKPIADGTYVQYCVKLQDAREQVALAEAAGDEDNKTAWQVVVAKIVGRLALAKRPIPEEKAKTIAVHVEDLSLESSLDALLDAFKNTEGEAQTQVKQLLHDKTKAAVAGTE